MRQGVLIKESLIDDAILDTIDIQKVELWRADNHTNNQPLYWTAITFRSEDPDFLLYLSKQLKEKWYVDLSDNVKKTLVFKGRIISYQFGDKEGKQKAMDYCKKIGLPESQIDWHED